MMHASRSESTVTALPAAVEELGATGLPLVHAEDLQLAPGELSFIDRTSPTHPSDEYHLDAAVEDLSWRLQPGGYLRQILTAKSYDVAIESPLQPAEKLSAALGASVLLKREDLQPVKSFKLRGAYNRMARLPASALARGVICSSAGNHAQGVALAARALGCSAAVCMPVSTPGIKVDAVRALGADVELAGASYTETAAHAEQRARAEGRVLIPPYDDPHVIAGQGTIASELLRQTSMEGLDAVFVPVGGGGLAAGVAAYVKSLCPHIQVIGVEPCGANAMAHSLARGRRVELRRVDVFADGVAVKAVGAETFRLCRELLDGIILVDSAAISAAIRDVFSETRSILEPSGAVAVAGAKAWLHRRAAGKGSGQESGEFRNPAQGGADNAALASPSAHDAAALAAHGAAFASPSALASPPRRTTVVAITSGANMNFDQLRVVSELSGGEAERECMLATTIAERPGSFVHFLQTALPHKDVAVTEFKYRYSSPHTANVLFSLAAAPDSPAAREASARLNAAGLPTRDLSHSEAALVHLRHLVGGPARDAGGAPLRHERLFQVDFPEFDGALAKFLNVLCPRWNISLFHYRRTGVVASRTLIGFQIPPEQDVDFQEAVRLLSGEFTFREVGGELLDLFSMFLY